MPYLLRGGIGSVSVLQMADGSISQSASVSVFQTIVSAMGALTPPVSLGNPSNQFRVDYIKSIAPLLDFEYTEVKLKFHTGGSCEQ